MRIAPLVTISNPQTSEVSFHEIFYHGQELLSIIILKGVFIMQELEQTLDSREVADMLEIDHWQLLRKLNGRTGVNGKHIKGYVEILRDNQVVVTDFFRESAYKTEQNKEAPCYKVTEKGCEFLANKFTGEKGVLFTARYINRFHEMENMLQNPPAVRTKRVTFLQEIKAAEYVVKGMNQKQKISFYKSIYERYGLSFDIQPELVIGDLESSRCDEYRKSIIEATRKIRSERRLRQIYTISKKMLEFDANFFLKTEA